MAVLPNKLVAHILGYRRAREELLRIRRICSFTKSGRNLLVKFVNQTSS